MKNNALTALLFAIFCALPSATLAQSGKNPNIEYLKIKTAFDETATKNAMEIGQANIQGTLYSKTYYWGEDTPKFGGYYKAEPIYASKHKVFLYPYTPYMEEYLRLSKKVRNHRGNKKQEVILDDRVYKYSVYTVTDEYGRFTFPNMKPGKYIIYSEKMLSGTVNKSYDTGGRTIQQDPYNGTTITRHMELRPSNWQALATCEQIVEIKPNVQSINVDARLRLNPK